MYKIKKGAKKNNRSKYINAIHGLDGGDVSRQYLRNPELKERRGSWILRAILKSKREVCLNVVKGSVKTKQIRCHLVSCSSERTKKEKASCRMKGQLDLWSDLRLRRKGCLHVCGLA